MSENAQKVARQLMIAVSADSEHEEQPERATRRKQ
jgi:hypothetical protein